MRSTTPKTAHGLAALGGAIQDEDWMKRAACKTESRSGRDGDKWFPGRGGKWAKPDDGKAVCDRCPVKKDCLDYALRYRIKDGTWGGVPEKELRVMINKRKPEDERQKGRRKLTEEQVLNIRREYAKGANLRQLADRYKVDMTNISLVINKKTWAHVGDQS